MFHFITRFLLLRFLLLRQSMYSGDFDDDRYTFQEYGITVAATTAKVSTTS